MTASGRANFLVLEGLEEDPQQADDKILWLTTIRSHDQYNTTIYSYSDRYRGIFGQRDILLVNDHEMAKRGLSEGDRVDLVTASTDGIERAVRNIRVVRYQVPDGCCAAYYPETNPLMPLYARDPLSHTPSAKAIPIRVVPVDSKDAPQASSDHTEAR
jgi:anaerobic selenocysteine-containing dehydrogenase